MKIRDLDLDQYVIVYDIGKSEHSEGMTVVGRVEEIVFNICFMVMTKGE